MPAQAETTTPLKVSRDEAVALFTALGLKMADGWRRSRLQEKLNKLPEEYGDCREEIADEDALATYDAVLEALGDEREVDLVVKKEADGDAEEADPPAKAKKKPATRAEDVEFDEAVETDEDGDELVPVHDKKAKAGKNGKPKVEKKEKPAPVDEEESGDEPEEKESQPKKLSMLDAAALVMVEFGRPASAEEIVGVMIERGLWKTNGKTPAATFVARMTDEIARPHFCRPEKGKYALLKVDKNGRPL